MLSGYNRIPAFLCVPSAEFVCFSVAHDFLESVGVLLLLMNSCLPMWLLNCLNFCIGDG